MTVKPKTTRINLALNEISARKLDKLCLKYGLDRTNTLRFLINKEESGDDANAHLSQPR